MQSQFYELLTFDAGGIEERFSDTVSDLSDQLNKDPVDVVGKLMPLVDNYFYAESAVGALAYDLWDKYPNVPKADMEVYTDAIIDLGNNLAGKLEELNLYNVDGICVYSFLRMLGKDVTLCLKEMKPEEYQMF